ncbi:intradiol ring-cleavage dioxygenase [Corallococcus llansteffanensis]|uniref:Dioxygenase n=1 Tax=Corallococcus llansteffanensis TaxID=2316731 RepID=A0A3A8QKR5_9BACT|nr:intradiol ring-cleavage dioxygenase [Corallococcus llansteffanensis]RKH65432.1 dioxygenase [Corallococcus llansteffanensis]
MGDDERTHHQGLQQDLRLLATRTDRRQLLRWMAFTSLIPLVGCGGEDTGGGDASGCSKIPEETAGPYPGDGSNGANALVLSGIVRSDLRSSIAGASGVAQGVPLTITLTLVDSTDGCTPLAGHAIYLWHCDRAGLYSMYSSGVTQENYLRGVQETDSEGRVTFTSIFPACYSGRWPHIHFEVYPSLGAATSSGNKLATSQLALPEAVCDEVFATTGYSQSVRNLGQISLASDNVFRDGASSQLASVTGNTSDGYVATLVVGITT